MSLIPQGLYIQLNLQELFLQHILYNSTQGLIMPLNACTCLETLCILLICVCLYSTWYLSIFSSLLIAVS